jgi:hypothetical protein
MGDKVKDREREREYESRRVRGYEIKRGRG